MYIMHHTMSACLSLKGLPRRLARVSRFAPRHNLPKVLFSDGPQNGSEAPCPTRSSTSKFYCLHWQAGQCSLPGKDDATSPFQHESGTLDYAVERHSTLKPTPPFSSKYTASRTLQMFPGAKCGDYCNIELHKMLKTQATQQSRAIQLDFLLPVAVGSELQGAPRFVPLLGP